MAYQNLASSKLMFMTSHCYSSYLSFILISVLLFSTTLHADVETAEFFHGKRLFQEDRFSEHYYRFIQRGGNYNEKIDIGDPQLDKTYRFFGLPPYQIPFAASPFKGGSFSCRSCHMVDEHLDQKELGMRAYSDFSSRSPLSRRDDNKLVTVRNAPVLVSSSVTRKDLLLHADGEFSSFRELIHGTMTGRNFGWLPDEKSIAEEHICNVIIHDDGEGELASNFGNYSYQEIFSGNTAEGEPLPKEYLIKQEYRLDSSKSNCNAILKTIAIIIEKYIDGLRFSKNNASLSPYDQFLIFNNLPREPDEQESDTEYSKRLVTLIESLERNNTIRFVHKNETTNNRNFQFHDQLYKFEKTELEGLKVFFNQFGNTDIGKGNCVACHPAPHFTDFKFHNIGVTQVEYEAIHGAGSFNRLPIPNLSARVQHAETYLPATYTHPNRRGIFRKAANPKDSQHADLGAWNILFNNDYPNSQEKLLNMFCDAGNQCANKDAALYLSTAAFKTPTLRDLGHSAPYMHNGQISDLHAVIGFYINSSRNSLNGQLRNPDNELKEIAIKPYDIHLLVQFLISLYEDYQ